MLSRSSARLIEEPHLLTSDLQNLLLVAEVLLLCARVLRTTAVGTTSIDQTPVLYLLSIYVSSIGHNLSDDEVIVHTLNGLRVEHKELPTAIWAHDLSLSFEEFYDKLTDYEAYLKREDRAPGPSIIAQ
ncbi:hypothetical protein BHE74_00046428, partial [Ensete ventricosum]